MVTGAKLVQYWSKEKKISWKLWNRLLIRQHTVHVLTIISLLHAKRVYSLFKNHSEKGITKHKKNPEDLLTSEMAASINVCTFLLSKSMALRFRENCRSKHYRKWWYFGFNLTLSWQRSIFLYDSECSWKKTPR